MRPPVWSCFNYRRRPAPKLNNLLDSLLRIYLLVTEERRFRAFQNKVLRTLNLRARKCAAGGSRNLHKEKVHSHSAVLHSDYGGETSVVIDMRDTCCTHKILVGKREHSIKKGRWACELQ
jgi:hypothetical protein